MICSKRPPFGNNLRDAAKLIPNYVMQVNQQERYGDDTCEIEVLITLTNASDVKNIKRHTCLLLIGDSDNKTIAKHRITDNQLLNALNNTWKKCYRINRSRGASEELSMKLISSDWVGIDIESTYTPYYSGQRKI